MDFKVIFRETFLDDLEAIVGSISTYNGSAARKFGEHVIRVSESLSFFPERFPKVRNRPGIRRFIVMTNYKVFYRVKDESKTVEILRCWDGRKAATPRL